MSRVLVVDYSNSNANSVLRALTTAGVETAFSSDPAEIERASAIVLPGVGHAGRAMATLEDRGLRGPLEHAVHRRRVPVLGICLGMQLMTDHIAEGDCPGLGWVGGRAELMMIQDRVHYKLPHIGWNDVIPAADSRLLSCDEPPRSFYFCHKFAVVGLGRSEGVSTFRYESEHVAAFERGNLSGVQFHPEKSHEAGNQLIRQWLALAA